MYVPSVPRPPWWLRLWRRIVGHDPSTHAPEVARVKWRPPRPALPVVIPPSVVRRGPSENVLRAVTPVALARVRGPWELGEVPPGADPEAVRFAVVGRLWFMVSEAPPEDRGFLERLARDVEASNWSFPLFPDASLRLDRFLRSGDPSVGTVATIVRDEPELVRRVWEAASGAAYGRRTVRTLDEAVVRLGLDAVWRVAMGACVHSPVFRIPAFQDQCNELRMLSPMVAAVADRLAPGGDAWLAGLLHDIGRLYVYRAAAGKARVVADRSRIEAVAQRLAPGLGMLIAANWGLPAGVVQSLAWLPDPERAPFESRERAIALKAAVVAVYQVAGERRGVDHGALAALRRLPTRAFSPEHALAEAESVWAEAHPVRRAS